MLQDPYGEDADGLGAARGIVVAFAIVGAVVVLVLTAIYASWRFA